MIKVIRKDGTIDDYNEQKIIEACAKASTRALTKLTDEDYSLICKLVLDRILEIDNWSEEDEADLVTVAEIHSVVEEVLLNNFPHVGSQYQQYRNYKLDFCAMLDDIYTKEQEQRYIGDVSNANTDSTLVSTQRSLSYGLLSKSLYRKFFLTKEELQAVTDGYIYIHDEKDRRDTMNCCLADIETILTNGFEMGNIFYNEPKSLDVAFDVIGDITLSMASQQYGGYTLPEIDKILSKYAQKSFGHYVNKYQSIFNALSDKAEEIALQDVRRDFEQGFQGWEYKFNTVASSRGDYPFIATSFGLGTDRWSKMAVESILKVRANGQGKDGFKKPVLFPKLTFLYDENLHGDGSSKYPLGDLFECAINCSQESMYPDYLSLTGEGYIPSMYKQYGKVVSLMG